MNRTQAEENYRKKFEEHGLSERFEYIGRDWTSDHGHKVFAKCKTCETEFLTFSVTMVFHGRQKRLTCPECGVSSDGNDIFARSKKAKRAAELYADGLEQTEIAEILGCTVSDVGNAAKKYNVVDPDRKYSAWRKANANRTATAEKQLSDDLKKIGFTYLCGYSDKNSHVRIRCDKCDAEFERTVAALRKKGVTCPECKKREAERRKAERIRIAKQEAAVRSWEREWYRLTHPPKNYYADAHESFLNKSGICEICGKPYTVREYVKSCGLKYARDNGVCSQECANVKHRRLGRTWKKINGYKDGHRHRAKKYGCAYDSSVTLQKLIERDGLHCAICGEMCDPNDHSWSEYSGPMYPSIDHIIPMSKGGGHVWDNVQVAHIICNSEKGDSIEKVV